MLLLRFAPMVHSLRMRLTWHFEVASLGCLNRKADMLVGLLEKIGHRLLFFSSLKNYLKQDLELKRLWLQEKTLWTGTSQSTASDGARHAAEERTHVASAALKQIEFWKKQKFSPPPLLLLSCPILLSFSAGACHRYGDGPEVTSVRAVFSKWTFNCLLCGCTNI